MNAIRLGRFRLNEAGFAVPSPPPYRRWTEPMLNAGWLHWPVITLVLATLAVLLVFCHVVREAVRQGELRNAATALRHRETWTCNALLGSRARETCLQQLNPAHDTPPAPDLALLAAAPPPPR